MAWCWVDHRFCRHDRQAVVSEPYKWAGGALFSSGLTWAFSCEKWPAAPKPADVMNVQQ
jgi:hypothetical protein